MSGVEVRNFGCRLNIHEGEVAREKAEAAGLAALPGGALVFNTCAVTGEAVRQAHQAIRKARRDNPGARIIVTGCAAQIDPDAFGAMDEVDLVIGNDDKLHSHSYRALPDFGVNSTEKVRVNDIFAVRENAPHLVDVMAGRTRAFMQVQNGCDHRCTFCIIPQGRGQSRSVPAGAIVEQVARLVDSGHSEVVLTGVDLTSYGPDLPGQLTLGQLVRAILKAVPDLARLRLSSIDSIEADAALMDAIATQERLMPHFHLSLQHGDDLILKRMKRRHDRAHAVDFCAQVRRLRPNAAFSADIIAGFPTETEAHFARSVSLIDDCGLSRVHVFPFSPREGTPAARMPQLDRGVIRERAARLRIASARAWTQHLASWHGRTGPALVEADGMARYEDFTPVAVGAPGQAMQGQIVSVRAAGDDGERLTGVPDWPQAAQ